MSWEGFVELVKHRFRYLQWAPEHEHDEEITPPAEMLDELGDLFRTHDLIVDATGSRSRHERL